MRDSLVLPIFVSLFMLMAGTIIGNSMQGDTKEDIKQIGSKVTQISEDVAVIKVSMRAYHPNGFSVSDDTAINDTLLASLIRQ